jgi:alcohol dehydrogenase class IV
MDALCQLIESYVSTGANPLTDALALRGIPLVARSLRLVCTDGANLDAREDLAMAALLSGITLTNAGLGAVHGFAAPLGANFPVPHGTVCGVLLPLVTEANIRAMRSINHPRLNRYAEIGRLLTAQPNLSNEAAVDQCIGATRSLAKTLAMPALSRFGMTVPAIPEMIALAQKASSMRFNPVDLSDEALLEILERGISGGE